MKGFLSNFYLPILKKPNKMMEKHFETEYIIISLTPAQFKQNTSAKYQCNFKKKTKIGIYE